MRLTLIARADKTGLGYQTKAYYKHLKPNKTIIIDISDINGNGEQHYEWYPNAQVYRGIPNDQDVYDILRDTDVLLTAETPYNMHLYSIARDMGVKTVCVENPEFYDHISYPEYEMPHLIILPSVWQQTEIENHARSRNTQVVQIHHPVDLNDFKYENRTTSRMLHIAGKQASHDRNGTWDYMFANPNGTVICQDEELAMHIRQKFRHADVFSGFADASEMYKMGDILVLPRKYGGNCLPLNEALASGMPVIMTNIEPNNSFLPAEWLVDAEVEDYFTPRTQVTIYKANHERLVEKMEWFRNQDMSKLSEQAYEIAKSISWQTLLPKYQSALESIL